MKGNLKITALAAAAAMFAMGTAVAGGGHVPPADVNTSVDTDIDIAGEIEAWGSVEVGGNLDVGGDINLDYDYDYNDNFNRNVDIDKNITKNETTTRNETSDKTFTSDVNKDIDFSMDTSVTQSHNLETNEEYSNVVNMEYGRSDVRSERDEHGVSVNIDKSLSLDSDIEFSGEPTISGDIEIDSAAIALIDNRQSNTTTRIAWRERRFDER